MSRANQIVNAVLSECGIEAHPNSIQRSVMIVESMLEPPLGVVSPGGEQIKRLWKENDELRSLIIDVKIQIESLLEGERIKQIEEMK